MEHNVQVLSSKFSSGLFKFWKILLSILSYIQIDQSKQLNHVFDTKLVEDK